MNNVASVNIALETFAGVILAIIMVSMLFDKNRKMSLNRSFIRILVCYLIVLISDILCWFFDGNPNPQMYYVNMIANFCVYAFAILGAAVYNDYIISFISTKTNVSKKSIYIITGICWVQVVLLIVSLFNGMFFYIDEANRYCRGDLFFVAYIIPTAISAFQIFLILRYRKRLGAGDTLALLSYNILLFAGAVLQLMLNLLMLLYVLVPIGLFIVYIRIQVEQAKRLENELNQSRVAVMLSQIQPHFLYNTLTGIRRLCKIDANEARDALAKLSKYLRGNMDSLTMQKSIPFYKELKHVEIYLSLEKMRFGDKLGVVFDITTHNFSLPALTLQPIVENAVRHGITKKDSGGTVTISTRETADAIIITVADDGNGFDPQIPKNGGNSHIGIENVRSRLDIMLGGTLELESVLGGGTKATITIPKEDKAT